MLGLTEDKKLIRLIQSKGRFTDVSLLGEGGHAHTFKAYDTQKKRKVAIKIPKKGNVADIIDEGFRAALLCPHAHIVQVYETYRYEGEKRALIMEFIEGCNLRQLLPNLRGSINKALKIAIHICKALQRAHEEHSGTIVHRDIKPENILISSSSAANFWEDAIAKLTDFGIALEVNTRITEVVGSLPYMAPEQIDGRKVDARSDLYAVAVVLYEMLENKMPFRMVERQYLIEQIRNRPPQEFENRIPDGLKRIVYKGLEKNSLARYQTASDMLCDLEVFQYFNTEIKRVNDEIGEKFPEQPRAYLTLSEMYTKQSIYALNHLRKEFEANQPDPSTSLRLALLHGAANEYDKAEAVIQETQKLDLQNPAHPLKQEHPFIKRFVAPEADEQSPEENTDSDEEDTDYTEKITEVKQLLSNENIEKARKAADEILNSCTDAEIYLCLCNLFYKEGILDKVIDISERGIKLHENNMELYALLGEAAYEIDPERAKEAMEKAIELGCEEEDLVDLLQALKE